MGMFDYVVCEIPGLGLGKFTFQSKDTQEWRELKIFTISAKGRLIKQDFDTEPVPEGERPYRDEPDDSLLHICGIMRKVTGSDRLIDQNRDGDLHFGNATVDYRATFRRGKCVEVCVLQNGQWESVWNGGKDGVC